EFAIARLAVDDDLRIIRDHLQAFATVIGVLIVPYRNSGRFKQKIADLLLSETIAMQRLYVLRAQDNHGLIDQAHAIAPNCSQSTRDSFKNRLAVLGVMLAHAVRRLARKERHCTLILGKSAAHLKWL